MNTTTTTTTTTTNSAQFDPNMAAAAWEDSQQGSLHSHSQNAQLNQFNDTFAQGTYFYPTSEHSGDALSSPSPGSTYGSSSSSTTSSASIIAKVKNAVPDKLERRREQNRSSQRAYRERRERQQRELEAQILRLQHEYQNLLLVYHQQSDELVRSRALNQQLEGGMFRLQHAIRNFSCGCISRAQPEAAVDPLFDMDPTHKMQTLYTRMYNEP